MAVHTLRVRRLGIDTHPQAVVYMRQDCPVCRSEGFAAEARVALAHGERAIVATLNVVTSELLAPGDAGLSEAAWTRLGVGEGDVVRVGHPPPLESLSLVRAKAGDALFTLHADSPGELAYALDFVNAHPGIVALEAPP